jgi:membrane-bound lytic murein transglycosylase B
MTHEEPEVRPAGPGLVRRLRLGSPLVRLAVLGLPLVAMTSVLTSSGAAATWVVPASANAGNQAWLDQLVGPAPTTSTGEVPPPDLAVVPSGGDPQVLVLPGAGTSSAESGGGRGASAPSAGPDTGTLTGSGIPRRVLQAYVAAARQSARIDASCHITWSLLAGIGRVETDHGRFGGAHVLTNGLITPAIYGPRLNGTNGMPFIHDTDGGRLDGDSSSDRAVGPMQFIPGTWAGYGADADGDGLANPQDVDDAALAAARYLCAGGGDLSTRSGQVEAVYRYNHSASYVRLVLALADSYATGRAVPVSSEPAVPAKSTGGTSATGGSRAAVDSSPAPARAPARSSTPTESPTPKTTPKTTPKASPTPTPSSSPSPKPSSSPSPSPSPKPSPSPSPSPSPKPSPSPSPSPAPKPSPSPSPTPSATPSASKDATPSPSPTPSASKDATPDPSPSPTPSASKDATPDPSPSPTPTPTATH